MTGSIEMLNALSGTSKPFRSFIAGGNYNGAQMTVAVEKMWDAIVNASSESYDTILVFDLDAMNPIDATVLVLTLRANIEHVDIVVDKTAVNGITRLSGFIQSQSNQRSAGQNLGDRDIQVTLKLDVSDCTFEGVVAVFEKQVFCSSN